MVKLRKCAWLSEAQDGSPRPVFARGRAIAFHCPKSIITPLSLAFLEQFAYWKRGGGDLWSLPAKSADALMLLQEEMEKENKNEEL